MGFILTAPLFLEELVIQKASFEACFFPLVGILDFLYGVKELKCVAMYWAIMYDGGTDTPVLILRADTSLRAGYDSVDNVSKHSPDHDKQNNKRCNKHSNTPFLAQVSPMR
jgi:hypothetical protein